MKKRARSEEGCVPLEYLRQLHELHENWLIHGNQKRPAPVRLFYTVDLFLCIQTLWNYLQVLVLDANLDIENIGSEYKRSESSILKPILIENTNQHALFTSPTKRQRMDY